MVRYCICNYLADLHRFRDRHLTQRLKIAQYRSSIWGNVIDDRRPNFVTAIARMTGLSGGETISTNESLYLLAVMTLFWMSRTDKRADVIAISVSSVAEVTVGVELPWLSCIWVKQISSSSYAESCFKNIMHLRDRGCRGCVRILRPLFVYATGSLTFSLKLISLCSDKYT